MNGTWKEVKGTCLNRFELSHFFYLYLEYGRPTRWPPPAGALPLHVFGVPERCADAVLRNNLDSDGATSVQEFLLMARKAAQMVEEANQITAEVKPGGSLGRWVW